MIDKKVFLKLLSRHVSSRDYTRRCESYEIKDEIYEDLIHNLKDLTIDLNDPQDKQIVNKVFSATIICLDGYYNNPGKGNELLALSIFKHIANKLIAATKEYFTIDIYPKIIHDSIYMKVMVSDKTRYYCFSNSNFKEITKDFFDNLYANNKADNSGEIIDFLPFTEME